MYVNPFRSDDALETLSFPGREKEHKALSAALVSGRHLAFTAPRGFGAVRVVEKTAADRKLPAVTVRVQKAVSPQTFAALIVQAVLQSVESRSFSRLLAHFRVIPEITLQLAPERLSVTFPAASDGTVLLEDAVRLIDAAGREKPGLTVIFDGFAEVLLFGKAATEKLSSELSKLRHAVCVFCVHSQALTADLFTKPKGPFYSLADVVALKSPARKDNVVCLAKILSPVAGEDARKTAQELFNITHGHPHYTRILEAALFDQLSLYGRTLQDGALEAAVAEVVSRHDMNYLVLWTSLSLTDRRVIRDTALFGRPVNDGSSPTSTTYSALAKLMRSRDITKTDEAFELADPFFRRWVLAFTS